MDNVVCHRGHMVTSPSRNYLEMEKTWCKQAMNNCHKIYSNFRDDMIKALIWNSDHLLAIRANSAGISFFLFCLFLLEPCCIWWFWWAAWVLYIVVLIIWGFVHFPCPTIFDHRQNLKNLRLNIYIYICSYAFNAVGSVGLRILMMEFLFRSSIHHRTCGMCFVNNSACCNVMYNKSIELHARTSQMMRKIYLAFQSD